MIQHFPPLVHELNSCHSQIRNNAQLLAAPTICAPHLNAAAAPRSVKQQKTKAPFGRASGAASRAAPGEALPNVCFVTEPAAAYTGKVKP